jgi:pyrophosphatase PpaX
MDLDQTLIDSRESILRSFEYAFERELGIRVDRERILKLWGRPLETQMAELAGATQVGRLVDCYREFLATQDHLIKVFPQWPAVLEELRQRGYRLAVVTSKRRRFASRHLDLVGLGAAVDTLVTADDTSAHKPDPEPFLLAARQLAVAAASCLAVGDSPWDIIGAKRAQMTAALAEWDLHDTKIEVEATPSEVAQPDIRLGTPSEILAYCPVLRG